LRTSEETDVATPRAASATEIRVRAVSAQAWRRNYTATVIFLT